MKKLLILAALISAAALAQTTVTIPAQTVTVKIPAQTITIPASSPAPTPAPVVTPDPTGVTWVYYNGVNTIAGDFTQGGTTVNYNDTTGAPLSGSKDIYFTSSGPWGLFLPYFAPGSAGYLYPNPGWTQFIISIKPKVAGQSFAIYFEKTDDTDPGCHLDISKYGPVPVAGKWGRYTVPLEALCVLGDKTLYKMGIQDQSGQAASWWMDNIGFTT